MKKHKIENSIVWNKDEETVDEIVVHDCTVHIEQMNDRCWWICMDLPDGTSWSGNFHCDSKGRMKFTEQDNDVEWDLEDHHT